MIYEVREYVPIAGRLGDVIELFKSVVIPLFGKHEMELVHVGFTTLGDNSFNELVYTMRFRDLAELEIHTAHKGRTATATTRDLRAQIDACAGA